MSTCIRDRRTRRSFGRASATFIALSAFLCACFPSTSGDGTGGINLGEQNSLLEVTPDDDLTSSGVQGGPFTPGSMTYMLENTGTVPLDWTASVDQPWVLLSADMGQLLAGEIVGLDVSIDQGAAGGLGVGNHVATVTITDTTAAVDVLRTVSLTISPMGGAGAMTSTVSQFGITWTFDQPHEVGQFANGDWWVVGPVNIIGITPRSSSGAREMNGSMIDPSPRSGQRQGYDSAMYAQYRAPGDYDPALNVARDVSATNPLVIGSAASLVSTISVAAADSRPQIDSASILTVLMAAPAPGSFRPAYSGGDKTIRFNESQLDYSKLGSLPPASEHFPLAEVERMFERPWLDHVANWPGRYLHPAKAMKDYGRDLTSEVSIGALVLNMNLTNAEKRNLLVRMVQLGIDLYGVALDGGERNWEPNQGHMSGRKFPILLAGIVLNDSAMRNIGFDTSIAFGEDGQTFYVAETSPGVYNFGFGGYTAADVGTPEWGGFHSVKPSVDDKNWFGDPYRLCCTANCWWGTLLAVYAMNAKALWNHDELFDYQDRFYTENKSRGISDFRMMWHPFYFEMWEAHRASF